MLRFRTKPPERPMTGRRTGRLAGLIALGVRVYPLDDEGGSQRDDDNGVAGPSRTITIELECHDGCHRVASTRR